MTPLKKVFAHSDDTEPHRSITAHVNEMVVRITCDAEGIAAVSHVMPWQKWEEMRDKIDGKIS